MSSNTPGIYKRGKTWTAHIHWTDIQGNRHQKKYGGFPTKQDAIRFRATFINDVSSGKKRGSNSMTLARFLAEEWLPNRQLDLKASTAATYSNIIHSYILPHLGMMKLEELTVRHVERFFKDLQTTGARGRSKSQRSSLTPKTVSNIANVLNRAYKDAIRWELVATNPVHAANKPSKRTREMQAWTPEELMSFIDHTASDRLAGIWHLAAMSGMRRGEILGLRWTDVSFESGTISIRTTRVRAGNLTVVETPKSRKSKRTIKVDSRTLRALERWKAQQASERLQIGELWPDALGHVVTEPDGTLPNPNTFTRRFKAICHSLGLREIRLHDLRHSYVVAARRSGVDLKTISERVGHADVNVTLAVYDHVFTEDDHEAATMIADHVYGLGHKTG